jgi:hypothetical protein
MQTLVKGKSESERFETSAVQLDKLRHAELDQCCATVEKKTPPNGGVFFSC